MTYIVHSASLVAALLVLTMTGASASRQDPVLPPAEEQVASTPAPTFKTDTSVVVLQVNVFNRRSDAVEQIPQSAFKVYEDDIEQRIEFFQDLEVPITVGLIVDNSSSMIARRSMVTAGVKAFADTSRAVDELFTVVFNENVRRGLSAGDFTRSRDMVLASLVRFPAGGKTALYDAVVEGLAHIEQASNQKRVLVVLSDGDDNASRQSEANMLHRARRSQALIYTIHTGDLSSHNGDPGVLRRLAAASGGVSYQPANEREVIEAFTTVGRNTRRAYAIGYAPRNQTLDGSYRRVRVTASVPGRSLSLRVRDGYTAEDKSGAQH